MSETREHGALNQDEKQLTLMFSMADTRAKHMLVRLSATLSRAMFAGDKNPLMGCSPMLEAAPDSAKCDWAMTE
jgi:hypothetical protein